MTELRHKSLMAGAGYDYPALINELPIGTRFECYYHRTVWGYPDSFRRGTVLWIGAGSVEIWWDGSPQSTRVQPELDVYILDEEPLGPDDIVTWYNWNLPLESQSMNNAVAAVSPATKALVARYNFQLKQLQTALENDDKVKASVTMGRIEKCIYEAKNIGLVLPAPPSPLDEYAELTDALAKAAEEVKLSNDIATTKKADVQDRQIQREVARERHKTEAATTKAERAPAKPKAEKKLRPCLDGCGQMVGGNFAMGHDAKLKSLLIKVERGDAQLTDIPEVSMDLVKIIKSDVLQDRDSEGNPKGEPKQTFRITAAPVRFPGRDDVELTHRDD